MCCRVLTFKCMTKVDWIGGGGSGGEDDDDNDNDYFSRMLIPVYV